MISYELIALIVGWACVFFSVYACYIEAKRTEKRTRMQGRGQHLDLNRQTET